MRYKKGDIFVLKAPLYDGSIPFEKGNKGKIIREPTEHGYYHIEWFHAFEHGHDDNNHGKLGHCWNFNYSQIDNNSSLCLTPQLELDL